MSQTKEKNEESKQHRVLTIVGIVLCIVLIPILVMNVTLIIKSYTNKSEVPSVGGYLPLIVLSNSMYPGIKSGDLIICHTIKAEDVEVEDVISFFDPEGNGTSVVTHRVKEIITKDGTIYFRTKGDNNNTYDRLLVPGDKLVGIYKTRIAGAGNIAMFMQTTPGLLVCVGLPLILMVGADILKRRKYEQTKQQDTDALLAELEALKAGKAKAQNQGPDTEQQPTEERTPETEETNSEP